MRAVARRYAVGESVSLVGIGGRSRPASVNGDTRRQGTAASPAVVCRVTLRVSDRTLTGWHGLIRIGSAQPARAGRSWQRRDARQRVRGQLLGIY